ncbi:MAG: putative Ig domain-containing protein, partial [Thermoplasmatota archaeon]
SNEDHTGMTSWHYISDADWLSLNGGTGELFGTPTNDDVGEYSVSIWVLDGNDGRDTRDITLTVINKNDPPSIITEDVTELDQGDNFRRDYEVEDIDAEDVHMWSLETGPSWLSMEEETGILSGTPGPLDVGVHQVKITVTDSGGLDDFHEFALVVNNVNDPPQFTDVPYNTDINHGDVFLFDMDGTDIDGEEGLTYSISTDPKSDMSVNPDTGEIFWRASIEWFAGSSYILKVKATLSDGEFDAIREFEINVRPSIPPTAKLLLPEDEAKVSIRSATLSWSGFDLEGDNITYDIYIGKTKAFVENLKADTLYLEDYTGTEVGLESLDSGKTYFWVVIPYDGCSEGTCSSGVRSFTLNNPPTFKDVGIQEAEVGKTFKILLSGEDEDDERNELTLEMIEGPDGMVFDPVTGLVKWEPGTDDIMLHQARFRISDGTDSTELTMTIDVVGSGSGTSDKGGMLIIFAGVGAGIASLVLVMLMALIYLRKRKANEDGENMKLEDAFEDDDEKQKDVEPISSRYSSVTIDANEAHIKDKVRQKVTYESLYGTPKPETDEEGMTTKELKEFIGDQIKELENLEE